jgi:hypothetical protein
MSKTTGLAATVIVDDAASAARTISNDVTDFSFSTPRAVQDVTGVDKYAMERLLLLADYSVTLKGVFNSGTANMSHDVFKSIPSSTSPARNVKVEPTSGSTPYLSCLTLLTDYAITRASGGDLTWQVPGSLSDGTVPTWN